MILPQQANGRGPVATPKKRPDIVIVGGGAGGLELATRLGHRVGRKLANIALIDKNPAHLWKPRLHEVAAGLIGSGDDEVNYLAHGRTHGYAFNMGEILGLDPVLKMVRIGGVKSPESGAEILGERTILYDNLVLALGSRVNDFGIEGVGKYCLMLDGPDQARRFERQFFEAALQVASGRLDRLRVGIIGAGATGVELAAELHHAVHAMKRYGGLGAAGKLDILLVDKAERVLPAVDPQTSSEIMATLERLGVKVVLGQGVVRVDAEGFHLTNGEFAPCQIKVWASGVTGLAIVESLSGLTLTKGRRIAVDDHLVCIGQPDIYAIGDCAMIQTGDSRGPRRHPRRKRRINKRSTSPGRSKKDGAASLPRLLPIEHGEHLFRSGGRKLWGKFQRSGAKSRYCRMDGCRNFSTCRSITSTGRHCMAGPARRPCMSLTSCAERHIRRSNCTDEESNLSPPNGGFGVIAPLDIFGLQTLASQRQNGKAMLEADVLKQAFAMPLTSPAFAVLRARISPIAAAARLAKHNNNHCNTQIPCVKCGQFAQNSPKFQRVRLARRLHRPVVAKSKASLWGQDNVAAKFGPGQRHPGLVQIQ